MFADFLLVAVFLMMFGLFIFQHLHYSKLIKDLTNRLMARNYGELVQGEAFKAPSVKAGLDAKIQEFDNEPDSVDVLNQLL